MSSKLYFAYGSNLNQTDLQEWALQQNVSLGAMTPLGRAWLPDHRLVFSLHSRRRQGGVLDVEPATGHVVPGVIFEMDETAWSAMNRKEGLRATTSGYQRYPTFAINAAGVPQQVETYTAKPTVRQAYVEPHLDYVAIVQQGYDRFALNHGLVGPTASEVLDQVAAGETPAPLIRQLFVYGTLMQGECRHPFLENVGSRLVSPRITRGSLVNLGTFPAMILPSISSSERRRSPIAPEQKIPGELFELQDPAHDWQVLDPVEEFPGYPALANGAYAMYHRTIIQVEQQDELDSQDLSWKWAWTYSLADHSLPQQPIESNSWRDL
ncbi:AIG2-like family protein [Planctopirus ephydatiae]|uniref:AIG2-like family protein n=1 Tax=Planctopirus ephydatiae TaxID=2528019 RepID=A0A518GK24_9PLAN|nr:gamma-glutamylcyclotransferase [Planctopirus ephydatiae]QDV28934.1 AIG2-like family protein [Planctopirus ephydatiae]